MGHAPDRPEEPRRGQQPNEKLSRRKGAVQRVPLGICMLGKTLHGVGMGGISAAEALYVGNDMLNDITPAHALGFRTALFAGDARSLRLRENDERVAGIEPDLVLTDLAQILHCVLGRRN